MPIRSLSLPPRKISGLNLDLTTLETVEQTNVNESKAVKIARYDNICSRITPSLYIGSDRIARDLQELKKYKITHILNCAGTICDNYFPNDFQYKTLYLFDSKEEDISCLFYDVLHFMDEAINNQGSVFVHCHQGISRSSAMLILYLMWREDKPFQVIHEQVKLLREVCNPNAGFTCQLLLWWNNHHPIEKSNNIIRMFHVTPHCKNSPQLFVLREIYSVSSSSFDPRGCFIVFNHSCTYIWRGNASPEFVFQKALENVANLQKFEYAPEEVDIEHQGKESASFKSLFTQKVQFDKEFTENQNYNIYYDLLPLIPVDNTSDPPRRSRKRCQSTTTH